MAVKYRIALIDEKWKERLHQYITAIVQERDHKMIAINSMPDHLHFFFGMRPDQSVSDLMRLVKGESSEWLNENKISRKKFRWQEGYGAFSYKKSDIPVVARYIQNQEEHHRKKTFLEEYFELLKEFEIDYDPRYVFKPLE
jgi:REP element-mobilizing transposase RayT